MPKGDEDDEELLMKGNERNGANKLMVDVRSNWRHFPPRRAAYCSPLSSGSGGEPDDDYSPPPVPPQLPPKEPPVGREHFYDESNFLLTQ